MGDLEERYFQQNVFGRWSSHNEYDKCDKHRIEKDADDFDEPEEGEQGTEEQQLADCARDLNKAEVPEPIRRQILANRMKGHQTGVKGVLADYKENQSMAYQQHVADMQQRHEVLMRMAKGAVREDVQVEEAPIVLTQEEVDDLLSDDEDDEFFAEFRRQRLADLKQQAACPTFGSVCEISPDVYLQEVYEEDARVVVIVHLFNNNVPACPLMNRHLESIAREYPSIKFVKMAVSDQQNNNHSCDDYLSTIINIDKVALPMLIFHKAGEVQHTLVGAEHEFNTTRFSKEDITWLIDSTLAGEVK